MTDALAAGLVDLDQEPKFKVVLIAGRSWWSDGSCRGVRLPYCGGVCDVLDSVRPAGFSAGEAGISWTLRRLLGTGLAMKLMLVGEKFSAAEAHRIGLVEDVVPDDQLLDKALRLAQINFGVEQDLFRRWRSP